MIDNSLIQNNKTGLDDFTSSPLFFIHSLERLKKWLIIVVTP